MAKPVENEFTQYTFDTPQEEMQSCILSESNVFRIRNQLARASLERAHLAYDPTQPLGVFQQQEAALMGEITAYKFMLDSHTAAITSLSSLDED